MTAHNNGLAIPKGIDIRTGLQVIPDEAVRSHRYLCIYCHEPVDLRKGAIRTPYFAHKKIPARTPLQKLCPGYHGEGSLSSDVDSIEAAYILNGGIPVYLCETSEGKYELRADFHDVSEDTWKTLQSLHVQVVITEARRRDVIDLDMQSFHVIRYLKDDWSDVELQHVKELYADAQYRDAVDEIKRKWRWGIQGVEIKRTFFRSGPRGGGRIAENGNIIVDTPYLVIHTNTQQIPEVPGIQFRYKGALNGIWGRDCCVREFIVKEATDEAKQYIGEKGYHLSERKTAFVPIWPPAAIKGRKLCYPSKTAVYLYRQGKSHRAVQWFGNKSRRRIPLVPEDDIYAAYTGQSIVISNPDFNKLSGEIQYDLEDVGTDFLKKYAELSAGCRCGKEKPLPIDEVESLSWDDAPVEFGSSSTLVRFLAMKDRVILRQFTGTLASFAGMNAVKVLWGSYGQSLIQIVRKQRMSEDTCPVKISGTDLGNLREALLRCNYAAKVIMPEPYQDILGYAKERDKMLYRLLRQWWSTGRMPYPAKKILIEIRKVLQYGEQ